MSKSRPAIAAAMMSLVVSGCALINLLPFDVTTMPSKANEVLTSAPNVWIQFPAAVDEGEVQPLFSVSDGNGQPVSGDINWAGNKLVFTPASVFKPGIRYVLQLQGTVNVNDGRTFGENIAVPFFVGNNNDPPVITSMVPASGSTIGVSDTFALTFSEPVNETSFSDAFTVNPSTAYSLSWNAAGTTVVVAPKTRWTAESLSGWTLSTGCTSQSGDPIDRQWTGSYLVQQDATSPQVVSVQPATVSGSTVTPLPNTGGVFAPAAANAIYLTFSKDVDLSTLNAAFSLSPSTSGTIFRVSAGVFVYVPATQWVMNQQYVLAISTALTDLSGNALPSPYRLLFTPSIPVQTVDEVDVAGTLVAGHNLTETTGALNNSSAYSLSWDPATLTANLELDVTIKFSQPYDAQHKPIIANAVSFAGYFPAGVSDPQITQVSWSSDTTLTISYSGFVRSPNSLQSDFYQLTIPGGASESGNQNGSFLPSPVTLLLESGQ